AADNREDLAHQVLGENALGVVRLRLLILQLHRRGDLAASALVDPGAVQVTGVPSGSGPSPGVEDQFLGHEDIRPALQGRVDGAVAVEEEGEAGRTEDLAPAQALAMAGGTVVEIPMLHTVVGHLEE